MRARLVWGMVAAVAAVLLFTRRPTLVGTTPTPSPPPPPPPPNDGRTAILRVAEGEKGQSDADKYWSLVWAPSGAASATASELEPHPDHSWCGAFALWVLRTAGVTNMQYDRAGAWFYELPWTDDPRPGDLAFIESKRHLGIVKSVNSDGTVTLINGAGSGGRVSIGRTARSNITEFRSVAPLVESYFTV